MTRPIILCLLGLLACTSKDTRDKVLPASSGIGEVVSSDTTTISGEQYTAYGTTQNRLIVLNASGDTILNYPGLYHEFEFADFDNDDLNDIVVHHPDNMAMKDLLLFDKEEMNFVLVRGFEKFPDPKPIPGTGYYYSYHSTGCEDNLWESDMFYIDHFEAHRLGNISGNECEGDKSMVVSKMADGKMQFLDKLTLDILPFYADRKRGFIAEYWGKNYYRFIEGESK